MATPPNRLARDLDEILEVAAPDLDALRGQALFVTGATGFFGRWLLETLVWANRRDRLNLRLVALARDPERFRAGYPHLAGRPGVELVRGDVAAFAFPEGAFPFVLHAATSTDPRLFAADPLGMAATMRDGALRVLELCAARGAQRALFASSGAVYGRQPPDLERVPEGFAGAPDPLAAGSVYGEGKRYAEHLFALAGSAHGFAAPVARNFAFVGPYLPLDAQFVVGNFLADALAGRPLRITGDGTPLRSYLYAADLVVWLLAVLTRGQHARAYNVGSDDVISVADLAREVATAAGRPQEVRIAREPEPGRPPERYVPDTDRARAELGLTQRVGLREALARTLAWHRGA